MKKNLLLNLLLALLAVLLVAVPAFAQSGLVISDVQPRTVSSAASANLVVTGSGFVEGAAVVLSNYGNLNTTFVSASTLNAMLPAGIPPGVYTITVQNPDSTSVSLPNSLSVEEPTPTSEMPFEAATPTPYVRPIVVVESYTSGGDSITPGQDFNLVIKLQNIGGREAVNLIANFTPGDFVPRVSGGVLARIELMPGEKKKLEQPLSAARELFGKSVGTVVMQLTYTDYTGTSYSETFNLTLPVSGGGGGPLPTATPTPTATASPRPQMVITGYKTDVDVLKPGTNFLLNVQAKNVGNGTAKRLTMIIGGGSSSSGGMPGTPDPGGVSGASGEFGNFAPVASSNVQFLGDLSAAEAVSTQATMIVNSKTEPGAYPMKISFTYTAENGVTYTDDQVITLLVYSPPTLEVNFYQDPGPIFAGQPNRLPLQVVNLGRKLAVLGNMTVSGEDAEFSQNTILVGALDTGAYYTLDATVIPNQPGPLEMVVKIDYTDDFSEPQVYTRTITVDVQEMVMPEPGMEGGPEGGVDGGPVPVSFPENETFLQKVWRFIRGLIGLDSGQTTPGPGDMPPGETVPGEEVPAGKPVPLPGPKG